VTLLPSDYDQMIDDAFAFQSRKLLNRIKREDQTMKLFIVKGCNVSVICPLENVQGWVADIIQHGGVPEVQEYRVAA